ncbi:MAG: rod-binding protein [Sandaracinaceae bacterium]|nr:rod-binding protein [Sandaracinaceae bacterium]
MTLGISSIEAPASPANREAAREPQIREAARQFEGLLLSQLVSAMRSSLGEGALGSGPGSEMYAQFFDQSFSEAMSASGVGLSGVFERALLGPRAYAAQATGGHLAPFAPHEIGEILPVRPPAGAHLEGRTGRLQAVARAMLPNGVAAQWGRDGRLTESDLASDFATQGSDGEARFNVRDAAGFEGAYKCNLFAFEMARRAGFEVPLIGRTRGWGYLGPDGVMAEVQRGIPSGWGRVATGESPESLDSAIVRGERAFLVTATGAGDRAGHMGVIERVRTIDYDPDGSIRRIVFDGWEGRTTGARHLTERTWNRSGNGGGTDARNGFERIEIVELRPATAGRPERPLHPHARPSIHDLARDVEFASSTRPERPIREGERGRP